MTAVAVALAVPATGGALAARPAADPVPAGATLDQLHDAAAAMFGPTEDLIGRFAPWVPVPSGIPTPPGAELLDFSINLDAGDEPRYHATVDFSSTSSPAELVTFFDDAMTAAGFTKVADGTQGSEGSTQRDLEFERPDPRSGGPVTVQILDADVDFGRLSWSYGATDAALAPFSAWFGAVPVAPGGQLYGAAINTLRGPGGRSVTVSSSLQYPGTDPATVRQTVLDAMPAAGFALSGGDDPAGEFWTLRSSHLPELSVHVYDWSPPPGSARCSISVSFGLGV